MTPSVEPVLALPSTGKMGTRTLIVGSTGFIGRFIAEACLDYGHPTFLLVRSGSFASSAKAQAIHTPQNKGAITINGTITDQKWMEKILEDNKIEVVISAVGGGSILDQLLLVEAMKSVRTVKRFLPSEFGHDIDRAEPVEPGLKMYKEKRKVRRAVEEAGIPYTYVCCNSIAAWPYHDNTHPADVLPPLDRFHIYGDGNVKAYFVAGTDIGRLAITVMNDKRTVNRSVHFRPPNNLLSINELASLWEIKINRSLPRVTITEEDLLNAANEMRIPESIVAALTHDIFIQGCQTNFALDSPVDLEVTSLYPDIHFRTLDECFNDFVPMVIKDHVMVELTTTNGDGIQMPGSESYAITLSVA